MEILFFLSALISEVIGTIAGFGSSTVFLPLALFFFDFKTSLVLVAFMHIFGNVGRIGFFRQGFDNKLLVRFGVPSVIATLVGALLVTRIDQSTLKGILGLFLALYALYALRHDTFHIKASTANAGLGGSVSGFLAGLIGTGGALRGAFLTGFGLPKEKYIATSAAVALAVDATRIPIYLNQGFLQRAYYWYLPLLLILAFAGSFVGKEVVKRFKYEVFRKIVLGAIVLVGVRFILEWLT